MFGKGIYVDYGENVTLVQVESSPKIVLRGFWRVPLRFVVG